MAITSSGLNGFITLPAALTERSSNLSAHERSQWDAIGFESWFKAAAHRFPTSDSSADLSSGNPFQDTDMALPQKAPTFYAQATPASIEASQFSASGLLSISNAGTGSAEESATVGQLAISALFSKQLPIGDDIGSEVAEDALSRVAQPISNVDTTGPRVTVALSGADVSVLVQDSQLDGPAMTSLRGVIAQELSWSGLALAGLKINGRELVKSIITSKESGGGHGS
jgi:hypothetical protein